MRRRGGGGFAEKVSIAVVSSHGAVCWGELGLRWKRAVQKWLWTGNKLSHKGRQQASAVVEKKVAKPCAGRAWGLGRVSGSTCRGSADASGQTSVSPVWLFLHWLLQNIRKKHLWNVETSPLHLFQNVHPFPSSHLTNKKSLNSWWSVNTGGEGRGGPNRGTLSSENIFNLYITRNNTVTLTSRRFVSQKLIRGVGSRDKCAHL